MVIVDYETFGWVSLNLAFLLDSLYYFPQVFKNHKRKEKLDISIAMHFVILLGSVSEFLYSFGRHMPWQYQLTTINCLIPVSIQYYQLWRVNDNPKLFKICHRLFLLWSVVLSLLYYLINQTDLIALFNGYLTQICFSIALIPQIIKNYKQGNADALSLPTFTMTFITSCCDIISAWSLDFDAPSRYGSIMIIMLETTCILQILFYRHRYTLTPLSLECQKHQC